ncbi:MAG: Gfo/Idh/MocA family protein, partial [Pseudomonadota bacterium]
AGIKLSVGYLLRFDPRYAQARRLIADGKIGDPIHLYARRNSARTEGPKRYGGKLPLALHVTVHDVDLVLWMLEGQKPVSVYAQTTDKLLGASGTQDTIGAIVRFSGGTLATFESAWSLPAGARHMIDARLELIGTQGSFEVQCGDSGLYFADAASSREIDTQHWPSFDGVVRGDLREELQAVLRWIRGVEEPLATGRDALKSLALTRAMMTSAETGEIVKL